MDPATVGLIVVLYIIWNVMRESDSNSGCGCLFIILIITIAAASCSNP